MELSINQVNIMKIFRFFLFLFFFISACNYFDPTDLNHNVLNKEKIKCIPPTHARIEPWEGGISIACKVMDGPFVAVENGRVLMRSEHKMGRNIGITRVYSQDGSGNVVRTIEYDQNGHTVEAIDYDQDGNAKILDLSEYEWLKK